MTTKETISDWFDRGVAQEKDFMIIVCDTFDYEDYPVFCLEDDYNEIYNHYDGKNMQRIMESYNLHKDKNEQINKVIVLEKP
jgi:hypothetical protein